ncbi:unnamed protein product [Lupinus luteus]|uniref:Uncharacterized protein n=1 Tax=Lupinus luteus TaxID=3873 RepID=A0AAV1YJZ3_LUPLU
MLPAKSNCYRKESHSVNKAMGDIFYGGDDSEEINDDMYKEEEDVLECMRKEAQLKTFKTKHNNNNNTKWHGCFFHFFTLFFGCIKF